MSYLAHCGKYGVPQNNAALDAETTWWYYIFVGNDWSTWIINFNHVHTFLLQKNSLKHKRGTYKFLEQKLRTCLLTYTYIFFSLKTCFVIGQSGQKISWTQNSWRMWTEFWPVSNIFLFHATRKRRGSNVSKEVFAEFRNIF